MQKLDYALFDDGSLDVIGIPLEEVAGDTPGTSANRLHCNLLGLTSLQLVSLAPVILVGAQLRVPLKKVGEGIRDGITSGDIEQGRLSQTLRNDLQNRL